MPYDGTFAVNIRLMFNDDRLAFAKGYRSRKANADQGSLALPVPEIRTASG